MTKPWLGVVLAIEVLLADSTAWADDAYITDANGCKIFDPHPVPNETVTWSGSCHEGYASGPGVVQWLREGVPHTRSEGTLVAGKATGAVLLTTADGIKFDGQFVAGQPSGHDVRLDPEGLGCVLMPRVAD
jgi:hypothetical protein